MLVDASINNQAYVEDCEVCCNPIQVTVTFSNQEIESFDAQSIEQ